MNRYRVSFFGDLAQFSVRELLFSLAAQRETGALVLRQERVAAKLYVVRGEPVFVRTSRARDGLIRRLFDNDQLDLTTLETWVERLRAGETEQPFVDFFRERSGLEEKQLRMIVNQWTRGQLRELMRWYKGGFVFFFDAQVPEELVKWQMPQDPEDLIVASLADTPPKEQLREQFRNRLDDVPILHASADDIASRLKLGRRESRIASGLAEGKTVRQLTFGSQIGTGRAFHVLSVAEILHLIEFPRLVERKARQDQRAAELGIEGMAQLQRLKDQGRALLDLTPFELMDIKRFFTEEDLRKGYYTIAQNFHRKEYVDLLPPDLRDLSYAIFEKASDAFEALLVWEKKRLTDDFAVFRQLDDDLFQPRRLDHAEAEREFLTGRVEFDKGGLQDAAECFRQSVRGAKHQSLYRAWLAWTTFQLATDETVRKSSLIDLRRCTDDDPTCPEARRFYAEALERNGDVNEAYEQFRASLRQNPSDPRIKAGIKRTYPFLSAQELETHEPDLQAEAAEVHDLGEAYEKLERGTYFEILGVDVNTPVPEIRQRYFELAKLYHPDWFKDSRQLGHAERIFVLVNEAYDTLSNETKRLEYLRSLKALDEQKSRVEQEKHREQQRMLQKGRSLLQANKWDDACEFFRGAIHKDAPDAPLFKTFYAWAIFNRDYRTQPKVLAKAEKILQDVLTETPELAEAFFVRGKIYRQLDQLNKAKRFFDKALTLDPDHIEALREIRLLNQRETTTAEPTGSSGVDGDADDAKKKGILGSLFNRKKSRS